MNNDAKRTTGRTDEEAQVSAAEQISGAADAGSATRKTTSEADWLSMTTGDPALYLKDSD
ncbi:MAG: hypothetical protein M3P70_03375 [Actinomycetota bacterium]|nr:hypothetical protein [Actinomycetota bacterium]